MSNRPSPSVLPLGRMLAGSLALLLERRSALLHALALPWLVHVLIDAWLLYAPSSAEAALPAIVLLRLAVYVLLAVNIHRLILLGPQSVPPFGVGPFALRELRYLGWSCAQILAAALVVMLCAPLVALSQPMGLTVALLVSAWLVSRMALLLPEIALGRPMDVASVWQLGKGAGFGLAVLVVAVPLLAALLMFPLASSGYLLLQWLGITGSLLSVAFAVTGLSLAWQHLDALRRPALAQTVASAGEVLDPEAQPSGTAAPSVSLAPDAARGILEVEVQGSFGTRDFGHVASGDGLLSYHGKLRGLVISLHGGAWEASEASWDALDTLLSHLGFVRVHHEFLTRIALVAPGNWQPLVDRLGKHFAHAELRMYPTDASEGARAWCAGEA
ncbi:MAG: STAS/SEC14 domain-containing protein [Gammaproteobacteria bacterium]|nr:STAS/SEC14 domain-containing protein [Gammaproteobacteria bacterium]